MLFVDVLLPLPLEGFFTYSVPQEVRPVVGIRVIVPFGKGKTYVGIVVKVHEHKPSFEVKPVAAVVDELPVVTDSQLRQWQWIADYYMCHMGDVYNVALPGGMKQQDGYRPKTETCLTLPQQYQQERALHFLLDSLARSQQQLKALTHFLTLSHWDAIEDTTPKEPIVDVTRDELLNASHVSAQVVKALCDKGILVPYEREVGRLNKGGQPHPEHIKKLSMPQQEAYNKVLMGFLKKNVVLLHGVTSSGKTELYIHLIQQAIDKHQQVLYLLPEIALTVQIMQRLRKIFGNRLGIYHSKYSDAERVEIWKKQLSENPYDIILGARSAVFLPFRHLGLVIIDEEHETSFKQQDPAPRYHARSVAIMMAHWAKAKVLLGTATPSVESYHNALTGKYALAELRTRYQDISMPEIRVVDVQDLRRRKLMNTPFSPTLLAEMRKTLAKGGQVILFQNRRGFAPMMECKVCGWVPKCKNCDVSLTFHKTMNVLTCHYCGYTYALPKQCPCCESEDLLGRGYGTEKIEDFVGEAFPDYQVARMDLDTTRSRTAYERIINDFSAGRTQILIGTQMVSKGLDFDHVGVVGILDADSMLNYPDFRAYEHAFMMMAQVSGRAGRKGERGLVILQTKRPDNPIICQVVDNDYAALYRDVVAEREQFHYPPYYRLVYVLLRHRHEAVVQSAAIELASRLRQTFGVRVLGPDRPAVAKVKQLHIRKVVVKLEMGIDVSLAKTYMKAAQRTLLEDKRYAALQVFYDVDPL